MVFLVITIKPDYLNTPMTGQHTITVLYTDGAVKGIFTIAEMPADDSISPGTSGDSHIIPWIIQMLICGCAVLTLSVIRRNKKT